MTPDALLDAVTRRWQMVQSEWALYLAVSAGVLAFVVAVPGVRADRRVLKLVAAGFGFFALTHLLGLLYTVKQWTALAAQLALTHNDATRERFAEAGILDAPHPLWVVPFHLVGDALVLAGLWGLRGRESK